MDELTYTRSFYFGHLTDVPRCRRRSRCRLMPGMVLGRVKRRLLGGWSSRSIRAHERNQVHISSATVIAAIGTLKMFVKYCLSLLISVKPILALFAMQLIHSHVNVDRIRGYYFRMRQICHCYIVFRNSVINSNRNKIAYL